MAVQSGLCGTWSETPKAGFAEINLFIFQLSIADLALYCHLNFWRLEDAAKGCPKILGALKKVEENKNLAKYLKERKDSPF